MFIYVYIVIRNFKTFIIPKIFSWLKIKIFSQIMGDFSFLSEKKTNTQIFNSLTNIVSFLKSRCIM